MQQNYVFIDSLSPSSMFRATVSPVFRSTLYIHLFGTMHRLCCRQPVGSTVGALFQKAVYTVKVLLKMGETVARNMLSSLKRINRNVILLRPVGYGYHRSSVCLYN